MKYKPEYKKTDEVHITSILVQVAHAHKDATCEAISQMDGSEIHIEGEGGKLIVSFESASLQYITDCIEEINRMDGVASATLIYHQTENADELDELVEVDPDDLTKLEHDGNVS